MLRVFLLPCAVDDPRNLLVAAQQDAVTGTMAILARVELGEIAGCIAALADVDGHREHRLRNGENRRSSPRGLPGEDEAAEVGARLGGDGHVLFARQAADLDEWPRQ